MIELGLLGLIIFIILILIVRSFVKKGESYLKQKELEKTNGKGFLDKLFG